MTELEWILSDDLMPMLLYLRGEPDQVRETVGSPARLNTRYGPLISGDGKRVREQRLGRFAQNCCAKWWALPLDETSRGVVISYERFLSGNDTWDEFLSLCPSLLQVRTTGEHPLIRARASEWSLTPYGVANLALDLAWVTACTTHRDRIEAIERTASGDDRLALGFIGYDLPEFNATACAVLRPLPDLLREVVGNPFSPVTVESSLLTPTLQSMAEAICQNPRFDNLPNLANALEESGYSDAALLSHLRGPGPHVCGCWALDLLLDRK